MLGSTALDVAIGLILIYSLLSLICSTINEGISNFFGLRATTLKQGLENLLGSGLASNLYQHHLVKGLVQQDALPWKRRPSYIPTRTFVLTALDTLNGTFPATVEEVRLAAQKIPDRDIQRAVLALIDEARGDFDKLKQNFGVWFDHSMDRVSGWYRRKIQTFLLMIAIAISFGLGVDTIFTVKALGGSPVLRAALVKAATDKVNTVSPAKPPVGDANPQTGAADALKESAQKLQANLQEFDTLNIPSFPSWRIREEWKADSENPANSKQPSTCSKSDGKPCNGYFFYWLGRHFLGFFLTAVALSLGAPFWFDLLNKLVSLRSTGQKPKPEAATNQPT